MSQMSQVLRKEEMSGLPYVRGAESQSRECGAAASVEKEKKAATGGEKRLTSRRALDSVELFPRKPANEAANLKAAAYTLLFPLE